MPIPSWLKNPDAGSLNSASWRISALLAGALALVAVYLNQGKVLPGEPLAPTAPVVVANPPPGLASNKEPVTDYQRRIDFCARHVEDDRSFVVFKNGTCVIIREPEPSPIETAIKLLRTCSAPDARFITHKIEAGCYMVSYKEAVFHCLFADEVAQLAPIVERSLDQFLTPAERLAEAPGWDPPFAAKLGLVARTFLNTDARDPQVAKVIRARRAPGIGPKTAQAELESSDL